jgi:hypothetical protein
MEKNDIDDTDSDNDNSDTQDNLSDAHKMTSRLKKVFILLNMHMVYMSKSCRNIDILK